MRKSGLLPSSCLAILLCLPTLAPAQFYNITTLAGNGKEQFSGGGQATNTEMIDPQAVTVDASGNIYISDDYFDQVFKVTPGGVITAFAGNGQQGFSGDGGQATEAELYGPRGLAVDSTGNLYIADSGNYRIRKVSPAGVITTAVSEGSGVTWVTLDAAGNLYFTGGPYVFKADTSGNITTIAGTAAAGYTGDGGPATAATLYFPEGLRVDSAGNVYVADSRNNVIRKINPQGIISTFAGTGKGGFSGEGGQATSAMLFQPADVSLDSKGNLYICDSQNYRIRVVNAAGIISTVAGGGGSLLNGTPSGAFIGASGIQVDGSGNILIAEPGAREVRRVIPQQSITTIAGVLPTASAGDNVPATSTSLLEPFGVAVDGGGNVYIGDVLDNRVRKVSPAGTITTVAGNGIPGSAGLGGPASQAELSGPLGLGFDPAGDLYVANDTIQEITSSGKFVLFAGGGPAGFGGDAGPATQASLLGAIDAVGDSAGNVYIADKGNSLIRKVDSSGVISTWAGNKKPGYAGDGGPATDAELFMPYQLALDTADNLYISDWGNSRVRKITPAGIISTVAGGGPGPLGDGGAATSATVGGDLTGVAVDAAGNLYIGTDARIRKVDAATGIISTIAGTGTAGFSGDGGLATLAAINTAKSMVAVDGSGNVYFSDENNYRVRMLTPAQIVKEAVLNGATFLPGGVSPGEIITIYAGPGVTLGPASALGIQLDAAGQVATSVGGSQVTFGSVAAALIYVSPGQINAIVPYEVAGAASTTLQVSYKGTPTNTVTLPVVTTSPGIFAITNQNGSVNSSANPVAAGGVLVLYGTGEGQTNPAGVDGGVNSSVYPKPVSPVSVKIGGQPAKILYAGAAPNFVAGVLQVDVQVPAGVTGPVSLELTIGDASTPVGAMVTVQ